jgi:hypothetical protein
MSKAMRSHVQKANTVTGKIALAIGILCLFAGCNVSCTKPEQNTHLPKAANPHPADYAKGVSPDTKLTWSGNESAASYNVYFGTESPPPFVRNQTQNIFDSGPLDWDQTYYWRIDTVGGAQGDIWKFTTFWYGDPNAEEMDVRPNDKNTHRTHVYAKLIP